MGLKNTAYCQYVLRCERLQKNLILGFGEKMGDNEFVSYILSQLWQWTFIIEFSQANYIQESGAQEREWAGNKNL